MSRTPKQNKQELTILGYDDDPEVDVDRGEFTKQIVRGVVDVQKLEAEVQSFLGAMERIIGNLSQQVGQYQMETITVSAEINAKGKVSLLGSGGEMGGKGGMSFTFKRPAAPNAVQKNG
jgi:hypothetical protein